MNKNTFLKSMELKDKIGGTFKIYTDIAIGKGINGVGYDVYYQDAKYNEWSQKTKVVEVTDDFIVIDIENNGIYPYGNYTIVLPLENVVKFEIKKE